MVMFYSYVSLPEGIDPYFSIFDMEFFLEVDVYKTGFWELFGGLKRPKRQNRLGYSTSLD